jgi:hypothetical protein
MKKYLLLFFLPVCIYASNPNDDKKIILKKIDAEITIDGIIDNIWSSADSVVNFFQLTPYYNQPPTQRTIAKVLTTDDAIYCMMICYQKREDIQAVSGVLDEYTGDLVSLMIDTFNDQQTAYKFAVSASGVRMDSRLLDDARNRDYSWDGIWFADSKIYDWGYVIEMKIPYKSIKYDKDLTEWGLDFDRWIPAFNEDLYWCEYDQNEGQRISKFGKLVFDNFQPTATGLNLEIYPVGLLKANYTDNEKYKVDPDAGLDIFYNPSQKLTYQLTVNPDFAQIEADPYDFNISRYESYFDERRPFFTEGQEVFMPSGRQTSTGFYRPLELFYSRRIGKLLPGGKTVPLILGTKAFGRFDEWEYGGFVAMTNKVNYINDDDVDTLEQRAFFGSARIKKQVFGNSSIGLLFVGKRTEDNTYGVIDIDGAFRESNWQLAYQFARSIENSKGDYAGSAGLTFSTNKWLSYARARAIGKNFDVQQVGFVPWKGTFEFVSINGPIWYYDEGYIKQILFYTGPIVYYEDVDLFTDYGWLFGFNMQLRDNWGYEVNLSYAKSKDEGIEYNSYEATFSSWYNISPKWDGNLYGGYERTYNFSREYLSFYSWLGAYISWRAFYFLELGTSYNMFIEGNPDGNVEAITYNARPFVSLKPLNDLNIRVYVDNVFSSETNKLESMIVGVLFSWNFLPKSWVYFAFNDFRDRSEKYDSMGNLLPDKLHVTDRASVLKIKYLYYF